MHRKRPSSLFPLITLTFSASLLLLTLLGGLAKAQEPTPLASPLSAQDGRLLVKAQGELAEAEAALLAQGLAVVRRWPHLGLLLVRPTEPSAGPVNPAELEARREALARMPQVRYAEPDYRVEAAGPGPRASRSPGRTSAQATIPTSPNDPLYDQQWALSKIDAEGAWAISRGDPSVVVALVDSGFQLDHEDLTGSSIWVNLAEQNGVPGVDDDGNGFTDDVNGWDWVEQDPIPNDEFGHGTHVGGTLVAATDNGLGIASLGRNITLMPLRVLDERGNGYVSDLIDALEYARRQQARVVNLSLVLRFDSASLHEAIQALYRDGILVVAATGNYGNRVYWPAAYTETLAVAAVDASDLRANFSNPGPETDVAAPGVSILSTVNGNSYNLNSGTSMATPHVAALAGLLWSLRPDLTHEQLRDLIRSTALDVNQASYPGPDDFLGWGRIQAAQALTQATQGLTLGIRPHQTDFAFPGDGLGFTGLVTAPNGAPVTGAVLRFDLRGPGDSQGAGPLIQRLVVTGTVSGQGSVGFLAPAQGGQYTLDLWLGGAMTRATFLVWDTPVTLTLTATTTTLTVDGPAVTLRAELRDETNALLPATLPVVWRTQKGLFAGGANTQESLESGGIFTATLHPGQIAGSNRVTVSVGSKVQSLDMTILPGDLHRIASLTQPLVIQDFGPGSGVTVTLELTDRFGNPVQDGMEVHFYAERGSVSPAVANTVNGQVSTWLTPQWSGVDSVLFWANVAGSMAAFRAEAPVLKHHLWLPLVHRQATGP